MLTKMKSIERDDGIPVETRKNRAPNPWPQPCSGNAENVHIVRKQRPSLMESAYEFQQHSKPEDLINDEYLPDTGRRVSKSLRRLESRYCNRKESVHRSPERHIPMKIVTSLHDEKSTDSDTLPYQNKGTKLEDRKARDSYYGAYSYGSNTTFLRNTVFDDDTPSPRGLTRDREAIQQSMRRSSIYAGNNNILRSDKQMRTITKRNMETQARKPSDNNLLSETMKIETRRTVVREGGIHFEETSIIQFPNNLPPNVQVITAQFVPGIHLE